MKNLSGAGKVVAGLIKFFALLLGLVAVWAAIDWFDNLSPFESSRFEALGMEPSAARVYAQELNLLARESGGLRGMCKRFLGPQCVETASRISDAAAAGDAEAITAALTASVDRTLRGVARLGHEAIVELAFINSRLGDRLTVESCASLARGGADRSELMRSASVLDSADIVRSVRLVFIAGEAEAAGLPPAPVYTDADLNEAWDDLAALLSDREAEQAMAVLDNPDANDDDTCWFEKFFWERLPQIKERDAQVVLWEMGKATAKE